MLAMFLLFQGSFWNLDDVSRMGALIEHAQFHADAHGDNFLMFLSKHYGELQQDHEKEHKEEKSQHERLPFQNHSCVLVVADLSSLIHAYTLQRTVANNDPLQNFHYQENYASLSHFDIFEPPRMI